MHLSNGSSGRLSELTEPMRGRFASRCRSVSRRLGGPLSWMSSFSIGTIVDAPRDFLFDFACQYTVQYLKADQIKSNRIWTIFLNLYPIAVDHNWSTKWSIIENHWSMQYETRAQSACMRAKIVGGGQRRGGQVKAHLKFIMAGGRSPSPTLDAEHTRER